MRHLLGVRGCDCEEETISAIRCDGCREGVYEANALILVEADMDNRLVGRRGRRQRLIARELII